MSTPADSCEVRIPIHAATGSWKSPSSICGLGAPFHDWLQWVSIAVKFDLDINQLNQDISQPASPSEAGLYCFTARSLLSQFNLRLKNSVEASKRRQLEYDKMQRKGNWTSVELLKHKY